MRNENKSTTSWAGSVLNGTYMIMGPIAGGLSTRYGCRKVAIVGSLIATVGFISCTFAPNIVVLIITYGVLGGIGFGLMYLPSLVMISFYFDKKRALATGIATCGSGIGAFIFAPMGEALIRLYSWKGAMFYVAGIVLNGVVLGALYRPVTQRDKLKIYARWRRKSISKLPENHKEVVIDTLHSYSKTGFTSQEDQNESESKTETKSRSNSKATTILTHLKSTVDFSLLKNPVLFIYGLSCVLCMAGFFVPFIYLPDKIIGHGYDATKGALLISILGITNTVGRVIAGWISDRPWADCLIVNNTALLLGGIATILCPFIESFVLHAIYSCIFGLAIAAFVSLRPIIVVDLMGLDNLTKALGIIVLCQGITSFVGAPFAGWLYDTTGNYNVSFYVAGATISLGGIICYPLRRLKECLERRKETRLKTSHVENGTT